MALAWVAIGYAASLFVNRSDLASERNRRWILTLVAAPILILALYATFRLRASFSLDTVRDVASTPFIQALFPLATASARLAFAPLTGDLVGGIGGAAFLVAVSAVFLWLSTTQAGWMYDQAAARGFDDINMKALARKGDMTGVLAEKARKGKFKTGRISSRISRWQMRGPLALVWREMVLQARTSLAQVYIFLVNGIGILALITYASSKGRGICQ